MRINKQDNEISTTLTQLGVIGNVWNATQEVVVGTERSLIMIVFAFKIMLAKIV